MHRLVRHCIRHFDARYAMFLAIHKGDAWRALESALIASVPIR
jgi:hypothetical protein